MTAEDPGHEPSVEQSAQDGQFSPQFRPRLKPWSAFAFRDYRILWLSSVSSLVTMQMRLLVTSVWLYQETGSGIQLGLLGLIQFAVGFPAILYGGTLADKVDRKKLIAFAQSFSPILLSVMAALAATDGLQPWHIYGVTAMLGITSILGSPARAALTSNVVPRTHLMHAVTSNAATSEISSVVAPLAFAGAITALGTTATFATAAIISIPSVVLPLMIRAKGIPSGRDEDDSVLRRIWEGFKFVKSHPILPGLLIMDVGVTIVSFYRQVLPLIADKLFRSGPGSVGLLTAANSFGGVIGSFIVLFLAQYRAKGMLVLYATLAYALLLIAFGLSNSLWMAVIVLFGLGVTDAIGMATRQTTVQLTTPDNMRGRAVSFHEVSAESANNIGTFEVGLMSQKIGASNTLILGGVISIVVVLAVWALMRGLRDYRYP